MLIGSLEKTNIFRQPSAGGALSRNIVATYLFNFNSFIQGPITHTTVLWSLKLGLPGGASGPKNWSEDTKKMLIIKMI